jgi:hypothetical protein
MLDTPPATRLVQRVAEHMPQTAIGPAICRSCSAAARACAGHRLCGSSSRSRTASASIAAYPTQLHYVAADMLTLFVHFQDLV